MPHRREMPCDECDECDECDDPAADDVDADARKLRAHRHRDSRPETAHSFTVHPLTLITHHWRSALPGHAICASPSSAMECVDEAIAIFPQSATAFPVAPVDEPPLLAPPHLLATRCRFAFTGPLAPALPLLDLAGSQPSTRARPFTHACYRSALISKHVEETRWQQEKELVLEKLSVA